MEGYCSTGQSQQWAVVPMEEEEIYPSVETFSMRIYFCVLNFCCWECALLACLNFRDNVLISIKSQMLTSAVKYIPVGTFALEPQHQILYFSTVNDRNFIQSYVLHSDERSITPICVPCEGILNKSWIVCVIGTNKMQCFLLIYFTNHPLHVSNRLTILHQEEVYCMVFIMHVRRCMINM